MTSATRYLRNPDLVSTELEGETVTMSILHGEYYGLGGIGSRIWELLQQPHSEDDLVRQLCQEYEVDEQRCATDVQAFVLQLQGKGLIHPL